MTNTLINESKREYTAIIDESGFACSVHLKLRNIIEPKTDDYEYVYALADILDKVLDLKYMEFVEFQPNRDNKLSKGIIIRTK